MAPPGRKAPTLDPGVDGVALLADGTHIYVNAAFARLLGYRPEELLGRSWHVPYSDPTVRMIERHVLPRLLSNANSQWHKRIRVLRKDGRRRDMEVRWMRGEDRTILCVARRRLGRRDRHIDSVNQRMHVAQQAQREFLAVVSHELRTPLTGILGSVELLKPMVGGRADGQLPVLLDLIETGAAHLLDLIGDVLDFSSAEGGRMPVLLEPVPIAQVCADSVKLVQSVAWSKRLTVSVEIDRSLTRVRAEPRRLRQILGNLLSNAVKFTPRGGRIGLRVTRSDDGMRAVFEVWDSGPGLTEAQIERLHAFEPYTRLMQSSEGAREGEGLGLSIVKRLVDLHSGRFSIHGVAGKGSCFRVEIPLALADAEHGAGLETAHDLPPARVAIPSGMRVLLVDDVAANVSMMSAYLTKAGFDVLIADRARRALDILRETAVDVLVCDVRMPDMDGVALTKFLRRSSRYADLPIVALTASSRQEDRRRCLAAGVNEYLVKPLPLRELAVTLARVGRRPAVTKETIRNETAQGEAAQADADESSLLLHDIHDALGAAIGNLDLALNVTAVCDPATLRDALDSCLRVAELLEQLRRLPRAVATG